ncbi:hypothetical protein Raf01_54360 [Rugosimonospora africana]|uniref:MFS transporter n=1 Tax=Rugosimonospora africana TaxID=556532 RepID=A0A8J3QVR4_9ACTN|nr:hypothetical protein Raf01_54360 [Rugosimonospora africana]
MVGFVAEVPAGALADRYSRRGILAGGAVLQACGYGLWLLVPSFAGFAGGFVLWGVAGALTSGTVEALLYDGLAATGAEESYPTVYGRVEAAGLLVQLPAAGCASVLFSFGGYPLVGWVSVGWCLATAALAFRLPRQAPPDPAEPQSSVDTPAAGPDRSLVGPLKRLAHTLRTGLVDTLTRPSLRNAVMLVAALGGMDAVEEYFPVMAAGWGVPEAWVPVAVLSIPLAGAAGAMLGSAAGGVGRRALAAGLLGSALALAAAAGLHRPAGLAAVALFYALYRMVLVVVDARLQERIASSPRATATSVASLGTELASLGLFAAWASGGVPAVALLFSALAAVLPRLLRPPVR